MLKHKYVESILQQIKFNTINIKFKFRILEASLVDENMDTKILIPYGKKWIIFDNSRKFSSLAQKIWIPHPPTVIPVLLVDSCRRNKIRTKLA